MWKPSFSLTHFGGFCLCSPGTSQAISYMKVILESKRTQQQWVSFPTTLVAHSDLRHHDWFSKWKTIDREWLQMVSDQAVNCYSVGSSMGFAAQDQWFFSFFSRLLCGHKIPGGLRMWLLFGPTVAAPSNLGVAVGRCGIHALPKAQLRFQNPGLLGAVGAVGAIVLP